MITYPCLGDAQQFSDAIQGEQWHLRRLLLSELLPFRKHMFFGTRNWGESHTAKLLTQRYRRRALSRPFWNMPGCDSLLAAAPLLRGHLQMANVGRCQVALFGQATNVLPHY